jgi:hypothetical protein
MQMKANRPGLFMMWSVGRDWGQIYADDSVICRFLRKEKEVWRNITTNVSRRIPPNYRVPALVFCVGVLGLLTGYYGHDKLKPPPPPIRVVNVEVPAKEPTPKPACTNRKWLVASDDKRGIWGIAEKEYGGRGYLGPLIIEASVKDYPSLATNPNLIRPGWILTVPCCLCDLPPLEKKSAVAKKVAPKARAARPVAPKPVQPPSAPAPCKPCEIPAPKPEVQSPVTAPKPPPAAPAPQQSQQVIVNVSPTAPAPTPAPAAKPTPAPQPAPPQVTPAPAQKVEPQPVKPAVEVKPPGVKLSPPKLLVGSIWDSFGQNPIEPGNFVNYSHIDFGVVVDTVKKVQIEPYVGVNFIRDTKSLPWDNRVIGEWGVKFVRPFSHGVVEVGGAYAAERRFSVTGSPQQTKTGPEFFTNGWFGRDLPTRHESERKFFTGTFPGAFQWRIGNVSPFERNNLIGWIRADQGFTLAKVKGISFIPTAMSIFTFDTDNSFWNRRVTYGGGMKVAFPWKSGTLNFQGGYQCAKQYTGTPVVGGSRCGPGVSLDFWTGIRKKIGGE